jgi:hypothetical protein
MALLEILMKFLKNIKKPQKKAMKQQQNNMKLL